MSSMHFRSHTLRMVLQAAGRDDKDKSKPPVSLTLVSFAVTRKAYQRITERFVREYQDATGQHVKFRLSFGASGTQVSLQSGCAVSPRQQTAARHSLALVLVCAEVGQATSCMHSSTSKSVITAEM